MFVSEKNLSTRGCGNGLGQGHAGKTLAILFALLAGVFFVGVAQAEVPNANPPKGTYEGKDVRGKAGGRRC